MTTTVMLPVRL